MSSTTVTIDRGLFDDLVKVSKKVVEQEGDKDELAIAALTCPPQWMANMKEVLFPERVLQQKCRELAARISEDYAGQEVICVGLLTGAVCFMTDLLKYLTIPYTMDFMSLSSYGKGTKSRGSVVMKKDMSEDPKGKHILLIEDIIDTGGTLQWLKEYLATKNCASVRVACLLDKKERRLEANRAVEIDYLGFHCPNSFVVGYGMDFAGHYRCLPFIGVLKPEAYADA